MQLAASEFQPASDGRGDPLRGLSVEFMNHQFLDAMEVAEGDKEKNVYDIEPLLRMRSAHAVCPRDGRPGAAYVDVVENASAARATHMLSYVWAYPVFTIVKTLQHFCTSRGHKPENVFVWICCVCINQHRVKESIAKGDVVPFEHFQEAFGSRVKGIGKVLCLLAPWSDPLYLSRIWCIFELYTAYQNEVSLDFILPVEEEQSFSETFAKDGMKIVWDAVAAVGVEHAKASVEEDRRNILQLVTVGPGAAVLNRTIVRQVQAWYLSCAASYANRLMKNTAKEPEEAAKTAVVCTEVADYELAMSRVEDAKVLMKQCKEFCSATGLESSLSFARLMICKGKVHSRQAEFDTSLACFNVSIDILRRMDAQETQSFAECLGCIGSVHFQFSELEVAMDKFRQAMLIFDKTSASNTPEAAEVLNMIGITLHRQGNFGAALDHFRQALSVYQATGRGYTPDVAMCMTLIGDILRNKGDLDGSLEEYNEALTICESLGTETTMLAAKCLQGIGTILVNRGHDSEALFKLKGALQMLIRAGIEKAPEMAACAMSIAAVLHRQRDTDAELLEYCRALGVLKAAGVETERQQYCRDKIDMILCSLRPRAHIFGLVSKPELNGCSGTLAEPFDWTSDRHAITLDPQYGSTISVKAENITVCALCELSCADDYARINGAAGRIESWDATSQKYNVRLISESVECATLPPSCLIMALGTIGRLAGLESAAALNGQWVKVIDIDRKAGRYEVHVLGKDKHLRIRYNHLWP